MAVSKEIIARILTAFLASNLSDPELFHPKDVEMVQSNEWWIKRFNQTGDRGEEQVKRAVINAMASVTTMFRANPVKSSQKSSIFQYLFETNQVFHQVNQISALILNRNI